MLWTSHPVYIYTCRLIVRINREYARRKVEYRRLNAGYRPSVIILIAGSFRREQNGSRKSEVRVASRQILFRWWRNSHGFSLSAFFHKEDEEEFCFFRNLIRLIRILCFLSRKFSPRGFQAAGKAEEEGKYTDWTVYQLDWKRGGEGKFRGRCCLQRSWRNLFVRFASCIVGKRYIRRIYIKPRKKKRGEFGYKWFINDQDANL